MRETPIASNVPPIRSNLSRNLQRRQQIFQQQICVQNPVFVGATLPDSPALVLPQVNDFDPASCQGNGEQDIFVLVAGKAVGSPRGAPLFKLPQKGKELFPAVFGDGDNGLGFPVIVFYD